MDNFDKLLEKKGKKMSGVEQRAKTDVLAGMRGADSDSLSDKLADLKKPKDRQSSLDKAKGILGDLQEEPDLELKPMEQCTPEEIDQKIQMLMDYKQELLQKDDSAY